MSDKLTDYRRANTPLPERNCLWPLYGAGFENLGRDGRPIEVEMPKFGPDELLVRHDAVGLCFSDIKIIRLGEEHPRIYRNMKENPVVQGHEVSMTVVGVGQNLRDQYHVGHRFIIQADIYVDGVNLAYGYEIQGGLSQYNVIDRRVLAGDDGNYLIPVRPTTGYAESALTEPWACVIAAYELKYRTGLKADGTAWIIGAPPIANRQSPHAARLAFRVSTSRLVFASYGLSSSSSPGCCGPAPPGHPRGDWSFTPSPSGRCCWRWGLQAGSRAGGGTGPWEPSHFSC